MDKEGIQPTGVREIARRASVSIGTVDRVLHNRVGVSAKTRDKIKQIIKDIDYHPNLLGRRLAYNKVIHLIVLIPKASEETSFWEAPLKGIEQAESEIKPYNVKIERHFFDQNDRNTFLDQTKKIIKKKVDGILLAPSFIKESIDFTNSCKELNIPYVFMDSDIPDHPSLCYIGPDHYHSGYLAANLARYLIGEKDNILIVNISTEIEHHLMRKEEGFRRYFKEHHLPNKIEKLDIRKISYNSIKKCLSQKQLGQNNIKVIFVTNSKVSFVAKYLKESNKNILLLGYDTVKENIRYLEEDVINFLFSQKPEEQSYKGIMALYKHIVLKHPVEANSFIPTDIIMKGNYSLHSN